jgi:hypothetical protein
MRSRTRIGLLALALAAGLAGLPGVTEGQKLWGPTGALAVPQPPGAPYFHFVVGDRGGAFLTWVDSRTYAATDDDVYAQRLLPTGEVAPGWPAAGAPLSADPAVQYPSTIIPDAAGGAFIFWRDGRNIATGGGSDIYGQHITASGEPALGWPAGGQAICNAPRRQLGPVAASNGSGGAIVIWEDHRDDPVPQQEQADIYGQHLTGLGDVAAAWPADGLPVCVAPGNQAGASVLADGAGGVVVAWHDGRSGMIGIQPQYKIYAARLNADGTLATGWTPNGTPLCDQPGLQVLPLLVPDRAGGVFVVWQDTRTDPGTSDPYDYVDIYVTRVTGAGALAPGWPTSGVAVSTAPRAQDAVRACSDGAGGVFVAWTDQQDAQGYVLRITGEGALAPGWPVLGRSFTAQSSAQYVQAIVPDELGGAYIAWDNLVSFDEIWAQHITPNGDPVAGWPAAGLRMWDGPVPISDDDYAAMSPDGLGGAIVAWIHNHPEPRGLYAQRLGPGGPTPAQVSLVSAEAEPGVVRLIWYAPQGSGITASVERRTGESDWLRVGEPRITSDGYVRYEDREVAAGGRYAYRLGYGDDTGTGYTTETWVEVPLAPRFALRGLIPNPSAGDPVVGFSLAGTEPATLDLFDIRGRLVLSREVSPLGPGSHELRVGERGRLPAGVYTMRLRQRDQVAVARAVVIR